MPPSSQSSSALNMSGSGLGGWKILLGLLLVSLLAALAWLVTQAFEPYEELVDRGWSDKARRNPFLAAEQLLSRQSLSVQSSNNLEVLEGLSTATTLIISNANHVLSRQRAADLVQWMERGGHVIVAAQMDEDNSDVLLSHFEVSMEEPYGEDTYQDHEFRSMTEMLTDASDDLQQNQPQEEVARRIQQVESQAQVEDLMSLEFGGIDYSFQVDFQPEGSLTHPYLYIEEGEEYTGYHPFYWAANDQALGFMQLDVGEGMLTVMADVNIWNSSRLALFDHAYLLQLLTESSEQVVFLYGALVPNLLERLWDNFREFCLALLALLAAWVIFRARRFGPLVERVSGERRSFREHLQAVGEFHWRHGVSEQLLATVRRDIWQQFKRRFPAAEALNEEQRLRKLADAIHSEPSALRALMMGAVPADEVRFYHTIRKLQQIRKRI